MPPDAIIAPTLAPVPASPTFDLTTQPWLPVLRADGTEGVLSLTEILTGAHEVRRLVGDVPTQEMALVRLLLAILYDALDGPADIPAWEQLWKQEALPEAELSAYLQTHRERFDLLHPTRPFFQVAGLRTAKDDVSSLDRIVADVPNGERFFTMRSDGARWLSFAEAARWVVHAHAYDPSGIKSGAVGDPRVKGGKGYPLGVGWAGNLGGVLVEGATLRETLLLNLIARGKKGQKTLRHGTDDMPVWRRPEPSGPGPLPEVEAATRPSGPRDLYTWQSRRLRLHHDGERVQGVVLGYGDALVSRNMDSWEPMTGWRRSETQEKKHGEPLVYMPRTHDPSRSAWRGLGALVTGYPGGGQTTGAGQDPAPGLQPGVLGWVAALTSEGRLKPEFLIRARLFGCVYGTQQSVIDDLVDDSVTMPVVLLREADLGLGRAATKAVSDADAAVRTLGDLATDLARAAGAESDPRRAEARDLGYGTLDGPFRRWLAALSPGDDPEAARTAWQLEALAHIRALGRDLVAAAGDAAWEGRTFSTATGSFWLNAASADLTFHRKLRKDLSLAFPDDPEPQQTEEDPE